jgi:hypothetical protein
MSLIVFTGHKGSGKDTCGDFIVKERGYKKINFADPLKKITEILFGLPRSYWYDPVPKEKVVKQWPYQSPRTILQLCGTECFRNSWPDIWIQNWIRSVDNSPNVVTCDCRFLNEAKAVKSKGGTLVRVVRPSQTRQDTHSSETEQDSIKVDYTIVNDGSIQDLYDKVSLFLSSL